MLLTDGVAKRYGVLPSDIMHLPPDDLAWNISAITVAGDFEEITNRKDKKGKPLFKNSEAAFGELLNLYRSPDERTVLMKDAQAELREARRRGTVG